MNISIASKQNNFRRRTAKMKYMSTFSSYTPLFTLYTHLVILA
jgi:hypothetical protein